MPVGRGRIAVRQAAPASSDVIREKSNLADSRLGVVGPAVAGSNGNVWRHSGRKLLVESRGGVSEATSGDIAEEFSYLIWSRADEEMHRSAIAARAPEAACRLSSSLRAHWRRRDVLYCQRTPTSGDELRHGIGVCAIR